jgi:hypothetical protein
LPWMFLVDLESAREESHLARDLRAATSDIS